MSEENKRWRCPYCDGLNDWQNTVCEICGDGRRDEADAAVKTPSTAEMPKTYTPPKRRVEPEALRPEPVKESRTAYAPPPPPASEPPKKKKKGGVWVAIVIVILAALGGRLLANSFVASVEKDKTDEFAVPISAPEATLPPEKAPAEEPAQEPRAAQAPAESTEAVAPAVIDTVTDNQNGTATLKLKINEARETYHVYWYCEGTDWNEPSIVQYGTQTDPLKSVVMPRDVVALEPPEDSVTLPVVPGCYTRFIIKGFNLSGGWKAEDIWVSEPYFFKESTDIPNFVITGLHFLKWDGGRDAYSANSDARYSGDVAAVHRVANEYTPTTAQALNELLRKWADNESDEFIGYEIHAERSYDSQTSYEWTQNHSLSEPHPFVEYLSGPGVHLMNVIPGFSAIPGDQFTFLNVFHDEYRLMEQFGGYPSGDYTIDFFYCGVKVYTIHFTLS